MYFLLCAQVGGGHVCPMAHVRSENNCVAASPLLPGLTSTFLDLQNGVTNPLLLPFISLSQLPLILVKIVF